jgi:hypothetical protein
MIKREYYKYNDFGPRNGSTFERTCLEFECNVRPVVYNPPPRLFLNSFRGSRSSSKLVRDEAYPPRPFIRSKSVGDPDEDEGDPVLVLNCVRASQSRCRRCGSGGTSGISMLDDGLTPVCAIKVATEPRECAERDLTAGVSWYE